MKSNRDTDALLIDWLYGELDPADSEQFEEILNSSEEVRARADALTRTRELVRQLPDEEPPPALSAILLHEAAVRGAAEPERDDRSGFWAWLGELLRPIALHPAAAAVTALVVVGGVAGTLYLRQGGHNVAQPEVATADIPAAREAGVRLKSGDGATAAAPSTEPVWAAGSTGEETGYQVGVLDAEAQQVLNRQMQSPPMPKSTSNADAVDVLALSADEKPAATPERSSDRRTSSVSKEDTRRAERKRVATKSGGRTGGKGASVYEPTANAVTGADPLGGAEGRYNESEDGDFAAPPADLGDSTYRAYRDQSTRESDIRWAEGQEQKLTAAVTKKRCLEAARIANDILDRTPDFYTKRVKDSKSVKDCQWYVSNERKKRSAARSKARAKAAKRATAVEADDAFDSEAKSAPAATEAAE